MDSPLKYFAELRDPRVERTREHLLEEILLMAIAAVLSGAESWNEIEDYGKAKRPWFKGFLQLPGGIPSHDTFNRVISALDPAEMEKGFADWVVSIAKLTAGEVVAIDGKALCGTREAGKKTLVHMVSAWASANNLVLAQRKVDDKSNEITAIPKLLDALELSGTVITIDAMGCQRAIACRIVDKKADYILAVKENQAILLEEIKDSFQMLVADAVAEEIDCGHGRVEQRRCSVIADLSMIEKASEWASLQGLVRIESERYHKATGKVEREVRYYITSLKPDAEQLNRSIRQHWGIENKLHWALDVSFGEDLDRKRTGHAAQNFSLLNRIALNLLKQEKTCKLGIKSKRLKAGWDNHYLLQLLGN
jgi:predicted transposase YbfD/YdcC